MILGRGSKWGAGNTWKSVIVEKDLGIEIDRKLSVRQQQEAFMVENPQPEPEPSLGDALTGALQACSLIASLQLSNDDTRLMGLVLSVVL